MPTTDWAIKNGEWKYIIQAYLACVSFVDHQVGLVLSALEKSIHKIKRNIHVTKSKLKKSF